MFIIQEASLLLSAQDHAYSQELYQKVIKVTKFLDVLLDLWYKFCDHFTD